MNTSSQPGSSESLETSAPTGVAPVSDALTLQLASLSAAQTQMQMMLSLGHMHGTGTNTSHQGHKSPSSLSPLISHVRSSSPIIPIDGLSRHDFCLANRFDSIVEERLKTLEFEPGDNLKDVLKEDWVGAGFTRLSWDRVVKVNRQYRRGLKI